MRFKVGDIIKVDPSNEYSYYGRIVSMNGICHVEVIVSLKDVPSHRFIPGTVRTSNPSLWRKMTAADERLLQRKLMLR